MFGHQPNPKTVIVTLTCGQDGAEVGVTVNPWLADTGGHDSVLWTLEAPDGDFTLGISNAGPPEAWPFKGVIGGRRTGPRNLGVLDLGQLPDDTDIKVSYEILIEGTCADCGRHLKIVLDPEMHIRR